MRHLPIISSDQIFRLLDWFIPDALRKNVEMLRRARMFMVSHVFGPFLGHTISLCLLLLGRPGAAWWIFFGAVTVFWMFPFGIKFKLPYQMLAMLSVQNLTFTILWGCYAYGGLNSPILPWVITIPLLAFFYLGSRRIVQIGVVALILLNLLLFYVLSDGGIKFPDNIPLAALSGLGIVSTLCAAAYVSMMALYYANIVSSQPELEREVARRLATAERLRQATDDANLANQAKSEFLAKMSHELRTPLNAIIGYSAMLIEEMEEAGQDQQGSDLGKIHQAGEHLLTLINDLLDISKLEAGKMEICLEPLDIQTLIGDVIASYCEQITAGGNKVRIDCPSSAGIIDGDATKLGRVLSNLLSNAVKFTHDGEIAVTAMRADSWITIAVRDTGLGIDSHRLRTLFEDFEEDENATTSKYSRTGLGLPLCAKLCRLMGGNVTVESEPGIGSCFQVRIPVFQDERGYMVNDSSFIPVDPLTQVVRQMA